MLALTAKFIDEYVIFQLRKYLSKAPDHVASPQEMEEYLHDKQGLTLEQLFPRPQIPDLLQRCHEAGDLGEARILEFDFPSAVDSPYPENNMVSGRYYRLPGDQPRPTLIILPGWLTNGYGYYEKVLVTDVLKEGCHAMVMAMPYHLKRTPPGCYSGEYAVSADLIRNTEGLRQGVSDVRALVGWVKRQRTGPVGLLGISLGGWVGSLTLTCEDQLNFGILGIPAVNPAKMLWGTSMCRYLRRHLSKAGFSPGQLEECCRLASPTNYQPLVDRDDILILEGLYDQCAKPVLVEQLWEAWGRPSICRYPLGHMTLFNSPQVAQDLREFISRYEAKSADA